MIEKSKHFLMALAIIASIFKPFPASALDKAAMVWAPAPSCVTVDSQFARLIKMNGGNISVPIVLTVKNGCKTEVTSTVPDECFTRSYEVADLEGQIVQHRLLCATRDDGSGITLSIDPGQTKVFHNTVRLQTALYKDKAYYLLVYQIWGLPAPIQKFLVEIVK